ncbi:MAG: hypothetical protein QOD02_427, partial [Mycobacterium sp.]|nr:hypothetical protein [Mycobacterium sp.]
TIAGATATTGPGCRCDSVSTPCRRRLPVRLAARTVEIYDWPRLVARHDRAVGRYVEVLARLLPAAAAAAVCLHKAPTTFPATPSTRGRTVCTTCWTHHPQRLPQRGRRSGRVVRQGDVHRRRRGAPLPGHQHDHHQLLTLGRTACAVRASRPAQVRFEQKRVGHRARTVRQPE